ncbi:MAG: hypothetical protein J6B31_05425 [Bacteroidaceae bacterium]|nr:hypothetical protein [Bacteroidaceae bacterium]
MTDFEYMKEALVTEVVMLLIESSGMDMKSALDYFYNSETYAKLSIPESGLYFQSPGYVFSYLSTEITTGRIG